MARPVTALVVVRIPGRPRGDVRVHRPAAGKASHRVVWTDDNGAQRERTCKTYDEAVVVATEQATLLAAQVDLPHSASTFGDLLDHYLHGAGQSLRWTSPRSVRRPTQIARRILLRDDLATPVTTFDTAPSANVFVRRVLARAESLGCSPGGTEYAKAGVLLKTVLDVAHRDGLIALTAGNPMGAVPYRLSDYSHSDAPQLLTVRYIGEEERPSTNRVNEFIDAATARFGHREGLYISVLAYGGLRPGEAIGLGAHQVRRDHSGLLINRQALELRQHEAAAAGTSTQVLRAPKWNLNRNTWLPPELHEQLVALADQAVHDHGRPDAILFPAPGGGLRWQGNWRRDVFVPVAIHVGWPSATVHKRGRWETHWTWNAYSFRHHYANYLLKDLQQPLASVARFMGHRDMRVTEAMYLKTELADLDVASAAHASRQA